MLKTIGLKEIYKDAGIKFPQKQEEIFEHIASSNNEKIIIYTKNEKISLYLSSLHVESSGRFPLFKALKEKCLKFGGKIAIEDGHRKMVVTASPDNEVTSNTFLHIS